MNTENARGIRSAEVVLPGGELDVTLRFFTDRLGFRVESIFPADEPRVAVVAGHGARIRLDRDYRGDPGTLRVARARRSDGGDRELTAPNGTRVELVDANPPIVLPPRRDEVVVTRAAGGPAWHVGRAGMRYRDLIPGRQGGWVVASQIQIADGGPVPDYVHFHEVCFQAIYCRRGAVRVVYEDQGEPFWMQAGDCVLQPPRIRHRVLEATAGLEVVELGSPAEHATHADHAMGLPTAELRPERSYDGQRFVLHIAADAAWVPWRIDGFVVRDTGIAAATSDFASVCAVRSANGSITTPTLTVDRALLFVFVLRGTVTLIVDHDAPVALAADDCFALPAGTRYRVEDGSADLEWLVVEL